MQKHFTPLILLLFAMQAAAEPVCSAQLTASDAMRYNLNEISVPKTCQHFTIHLSHIGKSVREKMGHNVVITAAADKMAVSTDGLAPGLANHFVQPNDKRVIAYSNIIGGGEKTSLSFRPTDLKDGVDYVYFCSFPGHSTVMTGRLLLK